MPGIFPIRYRAHPRKNSRSATGMRASPHLIHGSFLAPTRVHIPTVSAVLAELTVVTTRPTHTHTYTYTYTDTQTTLHDLQQQQHNNHRFTAIVQVKNWRILLVQSFYCPYAFAGGNRRMWIRQKTQEFSSTLSP